MRVEVEGIGIIEIDSLEDVPMLIELFGDKNEDLVFLQKTLQDLSSAINSMPASVVDYEAPEVKIIPQRMPERAVVKIDPKDIDGEGNIGKAEVEFFYTTEGVE